MALPEIVSREDWIQARLRLLEQEKEETRRRTALAAERRRLPMVKLEKKYVFDGPEGPVTLAEMFGDRSQLIIQHVMYSSDWDVGCSSCSAAVDEISDGLLAHLRVRDTAFALVSIAPLDKLQAWRAAKGWTAPWYSSHSSDFNYDFQVTTDKSAGQVFHNYRSLADKLDDEAGEWPGISCFLRVGDDIFHTYSTYERGVELTIPVYAWLDLTAFGRSEDWEEPKRRARTTHDPNDAFTD